MKKVGIITYHRADNFGSCLQTYALQSFLNDIGFDAHIIDYHSPGQDQIYKLYHKVAGPVDLVRNLYSFIYSRSIKKGRLAFAEFRKSYLVLTREFTDLTALHDLNKEFDFFICGSDQIWNPQTADFTEAYLLSFVDDKSKCISYAPSISKSEIREEDAKLFNRYLDSFHAISVREIGGQTKLEEVIHRRVYVCPDPVLLIPRERWIGLVHNVSRKPFVFGYFIGAVSDGRKFARDFCHRNHLRLLMSYKNLRDCFSGAEKRYDAGPLEFLSMIFHAELIVTNSFHALAFSILFKKKIKLYVDSRNGLNDRCLSLLEMVGYKYDENKIIDCSLIDEEMLHSFITFGAGFLTESLG